MPRNRTLPPLDARLHRARLLESLSGDFALLLLNGGPVAKSADENYPYAPNRNFLYVTGLDRENQAVLITRRGSDVQETVFVEPIDPRNETWNGKMMTEDEARTESGIATVRPVGQLLGQLNRVLQSGRFETLYLDLEHRRWDEGPSPAVRLAQEVAKRHPGIRVANVYPVLADLRRIKSAGEVDRVGEAVRHTRAGLTALLAATRPGRFEYQLDAAFQQALHWGGVDIAYRSIVAAGVNATVMHYVTLQDAVQAGQLVLVDAAAEFDYYKSDITRTFPVDGRFTDRQRAVYEVVLEASETTMAAVKPGTAHAELNRITRRILTKGLKALHVIRDDHELDDYYFYNVSHYLGLDTHDVGAYEELRPGMVLTVEPGLYIKDEALGVRIEDDIAVTEGPPNILSDNIPRSVADVEAWVEEARAGRS